MPLPYQFPVVLAVLAVLPPVHANAALVLGVPNLSATVSSPNGDTTPVLFVHEFNAPSAGTFDAVTIRQDADTIDESIDFLVLRGPLSNLEVIHRVTLDPDESGSGWLDNGDSTQTHLLPSLVVQSGDVFGHWHSSATGPIPTDVSGPQGGLSQGQTGVPSGDIDVGDFYTAGFIAGVNRDYLINVSLTAVPEPNPPLLLFAVTIGCGITARVRRRYGSDAEPPV